MNNYIKLPFILNINGFCGSGKSYFINYFIKSFKSEFSCIIIFSNTANFTQDYEFLNNENIKHFIFGSLDVDEKIQMTMNIQKKNRLNNNPAKVLIIFDDIFGSINNSKIFKNLITTYRHYNISIIFSAQYVSGAQTYLREISNFVILFNQRTQNALKLCYENYFADTYDTYTDFKTHFVNKLKNFHFYFIDRINNKKYIMVCPKV